MDADKTSRSSIEAALARVEAKLDILIAALAAEDEVEQTNTFDLDGNPAGGERDPGMPL